MKTSEIDKQVQAFVDAMNAWEAWALAEHSDREVRIKLARRAAKLDAKQRGWL